MSELLIFFPTPCGIFFTMCIFFNNDKRCSVMLNFYYLEKSISFSKKITRCARFREVLIILVGMASSLVLISS